MSRKLDIPTTMGQQLRQALIDRAIKRGQHADISTWRTVCDGCGNWVSGIWFVNEQGKRLCRLCSPKDKQ